MLGATAERGTPARRHFRPLSALHGRLGESSLAGRRADIMGVCVAMLGSLAAAAFSLQLWRAHLHVPLAYGSDALQAQIFVKSVITGGWIWHVHGLGAPFGTQQYDFPLATDNLNFLAIKLLGLGSSDSAKIMNVFFLLTFPAIALSSYVVLRWLGISVAVAVVCSVLFSDAPYHLFRGETHLLLSSYASVPIGAYLILSTVDGGTLFRVEPRRDGLRRWVTRRNLFSLVLCVMMGSLGAYYATFTVLILCAAGVAGAVGTRSWRPVFQATVVIALIGATIFINDLPTAIYRHEHGDNPAVADRLPQESELYALKLAEMVLPVPGHRFTPLAKIRYRYDSTTPIPSEDGQQSLGIVATIGLAWLFLLALGTVAGLGRAAPWLRRHRQLAFAALVAFLLGTLGGISALIGYLISTQIRGWDRISILIAFFAVAAVGLGLDALGRRIGRINRNWILPVLGLVLVLGIYDQSSKGVIPQYAVTGASYGSDALFVAEIQRLMPKDGEIFELPYVPYPENPPVGRMLDYDLARGYIHTTNGLTWSYGAMKGRPQDWASQAQSLPVSTLIDGVIAAGFSGIYIDRYGYTDSAASLTAEIRGITGAAPIVSRDHRLEFFDLRPFLTRLRARVGANVLTRLGNAMLHPPLVAFGAGFYDNEAGSRWAQSSASASLTNVSGSPEPMVMEARLSTLAKGKWPIVVITPDGRTHHFVIGQRAVVVKATFADPPGTHPITVNSKIPLTRVPPDPRELAVRYDDLVVGDSSLAPFAPGTDATASS